MASLLSVGRSTWDHTSLSVQNLKVHKIPWQPERCHVCLKVIGNHSPNLRWDFGHFLGMWPLWRKCFYSLLNLTVTHPSLCYQLLMNHSSQYWFHSPSQPLNSSWNIFLGGQIDQLPFLPFPESTVVTPRMTAISDAETSLSTVSFSGWVNPFLCQVTWAKGP